MTYDNGISIDGVGSVEDMNLEIAAKSLSGPVKRSVRVSVPFMSGSYDFSDVYGYTTYDDRELSVSFDVVEASTEGLESRLTDVLTWLATAQESEIVDEDAPGYHFRGSYSRAEVAYDESGLAATVEVVFDVYPYRIADEETTAEVSVGENTVTNGGARTKVLVTPTDGTCTIQIGTVSQTFTGASYADFYLEAGENTVTVTGGAAELSWVEEVL